VSDHYPVDVLIQSKSGPLRVGVFKIQVFGRTKVGKEDVLSILVKVVLIFFYWIISFIIFIDFLQRAAMLALQALY